MTKPINILDKDYTEWIKQLGTRYRRSQIKAAIKVNEEMLRFYWELGRDIVMRNAENKYGSGFMKCLSRDLKAENPDATCFSPTNLHYMKNFYLLYQRYTENPQQLAEKSMPQISPQVVEKSAHYTERSENESIEIFQQVAEKFTEQVVEKIRHDLFSVPWGHHMILIDKFQNCPDKALFFVRQTVENGWSRDVLLNFISTDLYERQGKALTNFKRTLPDETSDLAQELTKTLTILRLRA